MAYSKEFKAEFEASLSARGAPNEVFQGCMACISKHGHAYTLHEVHSRFFIPHRQNRGGLILSPHNAHRNAEVIYRVGQTASN